MHSYRQEAIQEEKCEGQGETEEEWKRPEPLLHVHLIHIYILLAEVHKGHDCSVPSGEEEDMRTKERVREHNRGNEEGRKNEQEIPVHLKGSLESSPNREHHRVQPHVRTNPNHDQQEEGALT
mmetsp:Transcript_144542/g.254925  ORF Transcript_144542/g.254925 Transcript_144542/m.254925 type:complete len:123 (+) Transcript_144542:252-620(+)